MRQLRLEARLQRASMRAAERPSSATGGEPMNCEKCGCELDDMWEVCPGCMTSLRFAGARGSAAQPRQPAPLQYAVCDLHNAATAVKQGRLKDAYMEAESAQRKIKAAIEAVPQNDKISGGMKDL